MSEQSGSKKQNWWHTLPGVLTAIAAVITALTGLLVGLQQAGFFSNRQNVQHETQPNGSTGGLGPGAVSLAGPRAATQGGMGILRTTAGNLVFDRITGMSMGNGKLTVSQLGTRVDIPLEEIKTITFQDKKAIRIDYRNGNTEETTFDCYWNLPVTFYAGDKEIYYGDCNDFRVVKAIDFHDPK